MRFGEVVNNLKYSSVETYFVINYTIKTAKSH